MELCKLSLELYIKLDLVSEKSNTTNNVNDCSQDQIKDLSAPMQVAARKKKWCKFMVNLYLDDIIQQVP